MIHRNIESSNHDEIVNLFTSVFTDSEGGAEGEALGNLTSELSKSIDSKNIYCYATYIDDSIVASIFFSRLFFEENTSIYMLSPVAVSTNHQRKNIGQSIINYGLSEMKNMSVDIVVTYGDISFYSKVGFAPLSEKIIQAPLKLSMPEGWLGLSIGNGEIAAINEKPNCVEEFNKPSLW